MNANFEMARELAKEIGGFVGLLPICDSSPALDWFF
jgi:hypothetical protein